MYNKTNTRKKGPIKVTTTITSSQQLSSATHTLMAGLLIGLLRTNLSKWSACGSCPVQPYLHILLLSRAVSQASRKVDIPRTGGLFLPSPPSARKYNFAGFFPCRSGDRYGRADLPFLTGDVYTALWFVIPRWWWWFSGESLDVLSDMMAKSRGSLIISNWRMVIICVWENFVVG